MSGLLIPDFGAIFDRADAAKQSRIQALALQRQADEEGRFSAALPGIAAGLGSSDPAARSSALAQLAGFRQGLPVALPMIEQQRGAQELAAAFRPAAPAAPTQGVRAEPLPPTQAGGPSPEFFVRLANAESGGNPTARNPNTSATGAFQFVDGTWERFAQSNPDVFAGMSPEQISAARNDPALSRRAAEWYAGQNARFLQAAGAPVNDATLGLAHQFGAAGALRLLRTDPNTPVEQVVGPEVVRVNPDLRGLTVGQAIERRVSRFAPGDAAPGAQAPSGAPGRALEGGQLPGGQLGAILRDPELYGRVATIAATPGPAQAGARALLQAAQPFLERRNAGGQGEPLERVMGPNGPVLVPRSQAAGMAPAPASPLVQMSPGDTAYDRERAKALAARASDWEEAGSRASQMISRLNRFEELNRQFTTGALANVTITAGQLAQRLGLPDGALEALGIGRDATASGEGIRSLAGQMLVGMIGPGGFPAQNFSNADREMLERALPGVLTSPDGNRIIAQVFRAFAEREREVSRAWREWMRTNGDGADSVRRFEAERLPAITERDVLAPLVPARPDARPALGTPRVRVFNPETGRLE